MSLLRSALRTSTHLRAPSPLIALRLQQRLASTGPARPPLADQYPLPDPNVDPQLHGLGYPLYPAESRQKRNPYGWDDMVERRNFGEPIPESGEVLSIWGPDPIKVPGPYAVKVFGSFLLVLAGITTLIIYTAPERPYAPREYAYGGLEKEFGGDKYLMED
ncbi:hypothetical protein BT69DRAFT_831624 [Atractiella rhizophila]|nr:hypothetical protein BT69DRAFT_831624 [Atractiella rhizophila]